MKRKGRIKPELSTFTVNAHNIDAVIAGITKRAVEPDFLVIDLFCGAGGTSTGFEMTGGKALVIACVNHDYMAIKSHWRNYPHIAHFEEDIRILNLDPLQRLLNYYRNIYPNAKIILWASIECKEFSKAKGGQPRDADSRTLAEHLDRYIIALNPDYIQIENVVEFMSWGPMDEKGKPLSMKNGMHWLRWRERLDSYGYRNEWKQMNSADFGAYTSRLRLFGIFAKPGLPIVWPAPTHAKKPEKTTLFSNLLKWKAVKDVLDFKDEGKSIFKRPVPLVDKTLERVYAGLIKFVAGGKDTFIAKYFSGRPEGKVISVDGPAGTIRTKDGQSLVQCKFTQAFMHSYYGKGDNNSSIDAPAPTITTKDRISIINTNFINRDFTASGFYSSIEDPAGTVMPNPKMNLVTANQFVMHTNFSNQPTGLEEPHPVITANRKWSYLINPSWYGNPSSTDEPSPVIIARQDKSPMYVAIVEGGNVFIPIYDTDSDIMRKIKEFMMLYGIVDIKMRMLKVSELLKIQGFPDGYILEGSQSDQKKFIGNSVEPNQVKCWILALSEKINEPSTKAA